MRFKSFLKSLGPGILFASTCIGVSHLVQSTRAGALYGFGLLWAVLAANLFKYPFFEYASRYASSTGESIIDGYKRLGNWMLWLYLLVTAGSMFFVIAAVGAVTAAFLDNLFGISQYLGEGYFEYVLAGLFSICTFILYVGQYKVLDFLIKIVGTVLLISTILAVSLTLWRGAAVEEFSFFTTRVFEPGTADFAFLIALMGWMPTALDISSWNSLWVLERMKQTNYRPSLKETLGEFNFGYIITTILAPCFLLLGAYLIYGTQNSLPDNAAGFANGIIALYTETIGPWSYLLIAAAAFSIMFGTCIAVFDGYSRAIVRIYELLKMKRSEMNQPIKQSQDTGKHYHISLLVVAIGGFAIIFWFGSSLKALVDMATTISFVVAPLIAIVNFRLVTGKYIAQKDQPNKALRILSILGIIFLSLFTGVYLWFY